MNMRTFAAMAAAAGLMSMMAGAAAASFPCKEIKIYVPVIGGTMDYLARVVAPKLSAALGPSVIVENRPGAGGDIATNVVAKAKPDGCSLLIGFNGPLAVDMSLLKQLPYNPIKDLAPISLSVTLPEVLVVNPKVPVTSVAQLVAYSKAHPEALSYGSIGIGSMSNLTMELFKSETGAKLVHVPYKGAAPVVTALLGDHVQAAFLVAANVLPYLKTGQLRALVVTGEHRMSVAPDVPTLIESKLPKSNAVPWIGFLTTAGTPKSLIDTYHEQITRIINLPEIRQRLVALRFTIVNSTPGEFEHQIVTESAMWHHIIGKLGIQPH